MYGDYTWDLTPFEAPPAPTDEEWAAELLRQGYEVLDGRARSHLAPRNLHDLRGLTHIGGGEFANETHYYERMDSPRGHRFYIERRLEPAAEGAGKGGGA